MIRIQRFLLKIICITKGKQKEPTPVSKDFGEITEPNLFNL
jgi:hypothetical protein